MRQITTTYMKSEMSLNTNSNNSNYKILILGKGYIGGYLNDHLISLGYNVDFKDSKELDYHDIRVLNRYLLNTDPKVVINCSGFTGRPNIDEAEIKSEECWELNVVSPIQVNSVAVACGANYIHVSSGCIYDTYEKEWDETDTPNYGLFNKNSSFYSKSKHAFEILSKGIKGRVVRLRMPFGGDDSPRNYLNKIRNYDNLIDYKNSKTYIPDLCNFVSALIEKEGDCMWEGREVYNVVNPEPLWTTEVCDLMEKYDKGNENWQFVPIEEIKITAGRSNCVLNADKANQIYKLKTEKEALIESLQ